VDTLDDLQRRAVTDLIGEDGLEILAKSIMAGWSVRQLAEVTGVAKSTVHARLAKARKLLVGAGLWPFGDAPARAKVPKESVRLSTLTD
jgi:hypothetical protein